MTEKRLLTVAEVAERLSVSESTVYDLVAQRKLSCHRIGARGRGTLRFTEEMVAAYLATTLHEAGAPVPTPTAKPLKHLSMD